jgi:hypothetical protein
MHENERHATEHQDRDDMIVRKLIAATNISNQPRYLAHVRRRSEKHVRAAGNFEQFSWMKAKWLGLSLIHNGMESAQQTEKI